MTQHNTIVSIHQMLDHSKEAVEMAGGYTRSDLDTNRMLSLALIRLMEIIGEAANRVPRPFRSRYPQVPWRDISDLRNRLIHGYDTVNLDILWTIIQNDLPPLILQLEKIISKEE